MRRLLLIVAAMIALAIPVEARFPRGSANQIFYNIVTDGSATCNGSGDDAPNFAAFNTWARANQGSNKQVVLTIPSGRNCVFNSYQTITGVDLGNAWAAGINNLIVEFTGATLSAGSQSFFTGAQGIMQIGLAEPTGQSARIQTVSAGASQVTLTASSLSAGYISRFPVGKWIMISGLNIQDLWQDPYGMPPNFQYFEWRQVTNVDPGTGVITLDRPLSHTYLSTWPEYNAGDNVEVDAGGPATIYALNDTWNQIVEYRGGTISQSIQTYAFSRYVTYRNVTFTGTAGGIPSQNEAWSAYNTTWSDPAAMVEVDKLIGSITMDAVTMAGLQFQSASVESLVMTDSTIGVMYGSPKAAQVTDTSFGTLRPGAVAYGISTGTFVCTRCSATTFQAGGIDQNASPNPSDWSMSGGVITAPNTSIAGSGPISRLFVPGGNIWYQTNGTTETNLGRTFQVVGITQDATNIYVQTSEAGSQPPISNFSGATYVTLRTVAVPRFTCTDCTGDPHLVAGSSQKGAPALAPIFQYGKQDYAPTGTGALQDILAIGNLVSISVNVTQAFTGSGGGTLNLGGQFHNFTIKQSDWTSFDWTPTINLKQAGERIITPSGVTCNGVAGGCAGDTNLSVPEAVWFQSGVAPYMAGDLSGGGVLPQLTITMQTNQQVVP